MGWVSVNTNLLLVHSHPGAEDVWGPRFKYEGEEMYDSHTFHAGRARDFDFCSPCPGILPKPQFSFSAAFPRSANALTANVLKIFFSYFIELFYMFPARGSAQIVLPLLEAEDTSWNMFYVLNFSIYLISKIAIIMIISTYFLN